jgi:hypothetical protein
MRRKYGFTDSVWENLGSSSALLSAVEEEKLRRMRTGQQKREKSQLLVTRAPDILSGIAHDANASPRHRVDAIKTLDSFAANGPGTAGAGTIFEIRIDLGGGHVEHYSKTIAISAEPNDVNEHDSRPPLTAIATPPETKTPEELALDALMMRGD